MCFYLCGTSLRIHHAISIDGFISRLMRIETGQLLLRVTQGWWLKNVKKRISDNVTRCSARTTKVTPPLLYPGNMEKWPFFSLDRRLERSGISSIVMIIIKIYIAQITYAWVNAQVWHLNKYKIYKSNKNNIKNIWFTSLVLWFHYAYLTVSALQEARSIFFGLGVYLLKSKFLIEGKHRFPWNYNIFSTYDQSLFSHWFPSNSCYHSEGNARLLILKKLNYLEIQSDAS